jgi:uncharacterized protein (DUF1810 family)
VRSRSPSRIGAGSADADAFELSRFQRAQDHAGTYHRALSELRAGRKTSHWMWFVFPQATGLGLSAMSQRFAIGSLAEARAYLAHPILGSRLRDCAAALLALDQSVDADAVLGPVDAFKLRSSMTLFVLADPGEATFRRVLDRFFDGRPDPVSERLLLT